jgi:hypothetical protein
VARDQPQPGFFLHKREEPGNEVDLTLAFFKVLARVRTKKIHLEYQ